MKIIISFAANDDDNGNDQGDDDCDNGNDEDENESCGQ